MYRLPKGKEGAPHVGKSKNGVYCAFRHGQYMFEVLFPVESRSHMEEVLKNKINIDPAKHNLSQELCQHTMERCVL
jgi:hypothetical protein